MDFIKEPGDLKLIYSHYGLSRCGIFTDGSVITSKLPPNTTGPLSWMTDPFDAFGFLIPGFSGYYNTFIPFADWETDHSLTQSMPPWEEHLTNRDPNVFSIYERTLVVWCGEFYSMFKHISQTSGAKIRFSAYPASPTGVVELIMRQSILQGFVCFFLSTFNIFPGRLVLPKHFLSTFDYGNVIVLKKYGRTDFIFLQSFEPACWVVLMIAILLLGGTFTLWEKVKMKCIKEPPVVRLFVKVSYKVKARVDDRRRPEVKEVKQKPRNPKFLRRFGTVLFIIIGLLFTQAPRVNLLEPGGLLIVWLFMVSVIGRCIDGSMRELMREAVYQIVPEGGWQQIFDPKSIWSGFSVHVFQGLPDWESLKDYYPALFDSELESHHSLQQVEINVLDLGTIAVGLERFIRYLINSAHQLIIIVSDFFYALFLWMLEVYRPFCERWLSANSLGIGGSDGKTTLNALLEEFFNEAYTSPAHGSTHMYMAGIYRASRGYLDYIDDLVQHMRDGGFLTVMFDRSCLRLEERFFRRDALDEQYTAGYTPVIMQDFQDPCILYACLLGFSIVVLWLELIARKLCARRPVRVTPKVRPPHD